MADFSALKTSIQNYIKQNGNEEITGNLLQQILLSMVSTLGDSAINDLVTALNAEIANRGNADTTLQGNINSEAAARGNADTELGGRITTLQGVVNGIVANIENGYVYAGIATPSTTPVSGKVFYLALTAGTYTNFGATVVPQGINILKYNGSAWSLDSFLGLDDAPTQGSSNLVKSGGVLDSIIKDGSAFDLSAYNSGTTYADLSAALTALNALPAAYKKGGMSFKYVQTYDNNYVQYRCKTQSFSLNPNDWAFCVDGVYIEHPEFIAVKTDAKKRILWGIQKNGNVYYGVGVPQQVKDYIQEKIMEMSLEEIVVFLESVLEEDKTLQQLLDEKVDKIEGKSLIDKNVADGSGYIENPEYLAAFVDNAGNILLAFKKDGDCFFGFGCPSQIKEIVGNYIEDIEGRLEIKVDRRNRVISYRKKEGTLVELAGIETNSLNLTQNGINRLKNDLGIGNEDKGLSPKTYSLPKYGIANIVSETFYLTSDTRYSDKNGVYLIEDYPDTPSTALEKITVGYFYIKSTLINNGDGTYRKYNDGVVGHDVKLDFYAASKVTKIENIYYVTSSLTEVVNPETGDVSYEVNENSIEVTQIIDVPPLKAWSVDKKTEHYCVVVINFGYYLSGTFYIGVKYQGSSSLTWWKRNLRFTFYKNNKYEKKDKIKIGEMIRLSGYNLKSGYSDKMRIKEPILYNLIAAIYEHRDTYDQYPWNKKYTPYTGATGLIKSFPIRVEIDGNFYGIYNFGLKKDEKNYLLDGDASGMFLCGEGRDWSAFDEEDWTDEMNDEMTQSNINAMTAFYNFINNESQFTKENIPTHMSVIDWIDYIIIMQTFFALDNTLRNMILYSDSNKTKMTPFWYDLDLCWKFYDTYTRTDIIGNNPAGYDMSIYQNFLKSYWDEVVNRYAELRKSVLNIEYITKIYEDILSGIPQSDYQDDIEKWGSTQQGSASVFSYIIKNLKDRFEWLDENYFKV